MVASPDNYGLLQLSIGSSHYAAPADQVIALRRIEPDAVTLAYGSLLIPVQPLALLLGLPADSPARHALLLSTGTTWHGLAVTAVEMLHDHAAVSLLPLPTLLDGRHNPGWVRGVLVLPPRLLLVLDLEAIIRAECSGCAAATQHK